MARRFLRQKSRSVGVLVVLGFLALAAGLGLATGGARDARFGPGAVLVVLVLAAGVVSKDASSGALQMILARPIRRSEYLFGRYAGILAAYLVFGLAATLAGLVLRAWITDAPPLEPGPLAAQLGYGALFAAQTAAPLLLLSTFLPGYGDAIAYLLLQVVLSVQTPHAGIQRVLAVGKENLFPAVAWQEVFRGSPEAREAASRAVLATAVCLVAAAAVFSRREFAYGRD